MSRDSADEAYTSQVVAISVSNNTFYSLGHVDLMRTFQYDNVF